MLLSSRPKTLANISRYSAKASSFSTTATVAKQKLVILGSGWGGYAVMKGVNRQEYDVTLVSPNTYFAFTPLLASTAVGTLEFRCALEPVRRYGHEMKSYQAWCNKIDFKSKTLECLPATAGVNKSEFPSPGRTDPKGATSENSFPGTKPFQLHYDKLVIACGAYSQTFDTPGVKEYGHFLKDVKDARRIRSRILECFEQAAQPTLTDIERRNLLHFVIVGGGPTGIEFGAELNDLLHTDLLRHYPSIAPLARVTIYDVAKTILPAFDSSLVEYAMTKFARQGVTIKNERHVTAVNETSIDVKEEGNVPFGLLVWSTGLAPNPLVESIAELKHDEKTHGLQVDEHLNAFWADGSPNLDVFTIGDAAVLASGRLPATAQVANQEAKHVAKVLNARVRGREMKEPFQFKSAGILTYVGDWKALMDRSDAGDGLPKTKEAGRLAWLLWRSAYWSQSLSWRNKATVGFYWFLNWIFGRDITRDRKSVV